MAYLQRVIFGALVLLSWFSTSAYASFPATSVPASSEWRMIFTYNGQPVTGTWYSTAQTACDSTVKAYYNKPSWSGQWGGGTCYVYNASASATGTTFSGETRAIAASYSCPSGSTLSGSTCSCDAGLTESGSTCIDANAAKCAAASGGSDLYSGFSTFAGVGTSFCPTDGLSSCASKVTGGFGVVKNGVKSWTIEVQYTGGTCTPPTSGQTGTETTCKGTVGTVNGITVCSPPSDRNTVQAITSTTATNPVAAASAPGAAGSTTSSSDTTCTGAKCTTTTTTSTTTSAGGTPVVTVTTKEVPKDDFCTANPRSVMCVTSSFGGGCTAGFVCEGDAVQCATAREIHTRNCRMFDQDSPESLLYGTEKNKAGSQVANENVAISSANFDTSDAIGGPGACITDKVVTVMGSPITIPFSGVCVHLAMLGNVLLTVSFLLAGRIFMRG